MTAHTPEWTMLPFVVYLLLIAVLPLFLGHFWEPNRNKLLLGVLAGLPVVYYLSTGAPHGGHLLLDTAREYVSFMSLLCALFVISGGIYLRGTLVGGPAINCAILAVGACLASIIGTTGASALLIRPLLRANQSRPHVRHIVIFFIFVVSNAGGLLTPLGDPPLFLGFLRGVPFTWTFRLVAPWALVNGALIGIFAVFDLVVRRRDGASVSPPSHQRASLRIEGGLNGLWLFGVVGIIFVNGTYGAQLFGGAGTRAAAQIVGMVIFTALSLLTTPKRVHEDNMFSWAPLLEVAAVFVGIFITMVPALSFLEERGAALGVTKPWQFFWASGVLSSVLDNAPTYLTFSSLATGVVDAGRGLMSASDLGLLAADPTGARLLAAVSCGSVFMGAVTYIGNGPNFMVKAIAEQHKVRMPGFFGYVGWSVSILIPLFGIVSLLFF